MFKKKIQDLTIDDILKIAIWDEEEEGVLTPFFFDPNQEILVPLFHDVVDARLFVRASLQSNSSNFYAIVRYSNDLFYSNNDFAALNCWYFYNGINKLDIDHLPVKISIPFKTYPFFNNYLIFSLHKSDILTFSEKFFNFLASFSNINVLLTGDLGSGKTTFVRSFLGTSSPSFNIMYSIKKNNLTFNHWDLYRIEVDYENLNNIDFWYYINKDNVVNLIEWANKIRLEFYLQNTTNLICVNFAYTESEEKRIVTISSFNPEYIKHFFIDNNQL